MRYIFSCLCFFIIGQEALAVKRCKPCPSWWQKGWAATFYSGPLTSQNTSDFIVDFHFEGSEIVALAGSKELVRVWDNKLDFELEAQAVQYVGKQTHFEFNPIVFIARWRSFPWNHIVCTTFAAGEGLSIATSPPKLEKRTHPRYNKILNYLMAELTLSLPSMPQWAIIARYHHRSGVFGAYNGVHDASTAFAAGIKYWF